MTWAEFQLRSFAYWEDRKFFMQMTREVSYEVHGLNYLFGKKKRPSKKKFWPLEKKKGISESAKQYFLEKVKEYKDG